MKEHLKKLHETKNYDEIYNLIETKFSQFESRWNSVLASEEGVKLYRNTKLSDNNRDKIYRKLFAELIIKECLSIVDDAERGGSNEVWDNAVKFVKRDLQEHFGVEE